MKNLILVFSLIFFFISCKNQEKREETEDIRITEQEDDSYGNPERDTENSASRTSPNRENTTNKSTESPDTQSSNSDIKNSGNISNGKYVKNDENDTACLCYCVDIVTTGQSELCLKENEIYINVRFTKSGNTTQVYFIGPSEKNSNEDLPWEDFDTNTPIAEITPTANGIDLDWIGFSTDGKLALDYAIYGKKTLEGTYRKY